MTVEKYFIYRPSAGVNYFLTAEEPVIPILRWVKGWHVVSDVSPLEVNTAQPGSWWRDSARSLMDALTKVGVVQVATERQGLLTIFPAAGGRNLRALERALREVAEACLGIGRISVVEDAIVKWHWALLAEGHMTSLAWTSNDPMWGGETLTPSCFLEEASMYQWRYEIGTLQCQDDTKRTIVRFASEDHEAFANVVVPLDWDEPREICGARPATMAGNDLVDDDHNDAADEGDS